MMKASNQTLKFLVFLFLILPSAISSLYSKTLFVPNQYRTIQFAINGARTGDTVLVDDGIYYENLRINKNIVLASRFIIDKAPSHVSNTIIDGSKPSNVLKASVIYISGTTDTNCVIVGFTLRRGTGTYLHVPPDPIWNSIPYGFSVHNIAGGGILIDNASARIAYNIVTENSLSTRYKNNFSFGAGIGSNDSTYGKNIPPYIIVEHNTVIHNISDGDEFAEGGGVDIGQPGIIRFNTITDNRTTSHKRSVGGGVNLCQNSNFDLLLDGNYICRNYADIGAGMIVSSGFIRRGRSIVTNNIFVDNEAFEVGGGVHVGGDSYVLFINNTVVRNTALASGGGIFVEKESHCSLINNIIWGNNEEELSVHGDFQAISNLIEGGHTGRDNIRDDPKFLPDDSLYRLSPNSPCIGTGTDRISIIEKSFPMPDHDYFGRQRPVPYGTSYDIGAIESSFEPSFTATKIRETRNASSDSKFKFTIVIDQITLGDRDPVTSKIIRAGKMHTILIVNDSTRYTLNDSLPVPAFIISPENNLIELELIGRAMQRDKGINVSFWFEGLDSYVSLLPKAHEVIYRCYSELKPGKYKLFFQPQDQENIIRYTNKFFIEIIVLPYWYQRWWAYAVFGFGVIGIAIGFYQMQVVRIRLAQKLSREQLQADKITEMSNVKSRFLANISHELRTPLTMIIGPIDALIAQTSDQELKEQLGYIQRNSRKLLRLIEQLLQFSRLESGKIRLRVSPMDVIPFLRRITGYYISQAAKNQIDLQFVSSVDTIHGMIDAEKIEHILQNCISNALKYTHSGGSITIRTWQEKNELVFSIKDTGDGIAPEHLPHVFDRFYRVDPTHKMEGTGIGLSLSRELAEVHRGTIFLDSELGKGTMVTVRIPLTGYTETEFSSVPYVPQEIETKNSTSSPLPEPPSGEKDELPIILIAEDNIDARGFIRLQLSKQYTVIEALDGEDALNKTKFQIPDLVISDVMMPKKNGWELCRELKKDERTSHIPVILLTALAEKEDKLKGLDSGADDYLVKPFDANELHSRVRNLLEIRTKLRESYGKTVPLKLGEVFVTALDDAFLDKAFGIVNAHLSESEFSVEAFAHEMFLSRTQLQRKIKAVTNFSPSDFIRHLRLQRAKELLEKNAGTVAEIADRVGFNNHSYFAKCFQEQFGILPNHIRNPHK
jgi:signal transduction histidine kinase/DNA-binding response OmpR family regulator